MPNLTVVDHPLIRHKLGLLRSVDTPVKLFRELVDEISTLMAYEATRDLAEEPTDVQTPLEQMVGSRLAGGKLVIVPVLRAGLGMVEGVLRLLPSARVGHVGMARDEESLQPDEYYFKIPEHPEERRFLVVDPMLATGGSAAAAIDGLKRRGVRKITLMCLVAAPEGVRALLEAHPDVSIFAAALDRKLNQLGYIVPGLGDAGDRLYGTK
ncbi:MAG: uracil phosphoribosyltransferase [Gemmatimonadales bacterium]|nr:uracil phosphoribosyltransferase [Gemmatimonadales bacterium]MBT3497259.1 uracil phosphoribosyltransferase [Gemmatimonadales bacterium]MBT3775307.1 uracil phosphoribosyltransferase [Gemmatimonadales bacterium]MBT3957403.1 uracil phosphoribosyltransferase [Gemmatimonadales bacterium]MBT4436520.1 uracil phosphoribosyltransferase [Gemmatimonadales bacterium]